MARRAVILRPLTRRRRLILVAACLGVVACLGLAWLHRVLASEPTTYIKVTNESGQAVTQVVVTTPLGERAFGALGDGRSCGLTVPHEAIRDIKVGFVDGEGKPQVVGAGFSMSPGFFLSTVRINLMRNRHGIDYDHAPTFEVLKIRFFRHVSELRRRLGL